jgi:hypothetical protein
MALINRASGRVIAWGGEVEGPAEMRNEMGALLAMTSYTAMLGVGGAELREIVVYVPHASRIALGRSVPETEELVKKCVVRRIENQCVNSWVPENKEHFTIYEDEMLNLREQVLKAAA